MPSPPKFPTTYIRPQSPSRPLPSKPTIITDPIPPFEEEFDEEILMELPPVTHPDFINLQFISPLPIHTPSLDSLLQRATSSFPHGPATTAAGPQVFTRVEVPGLDYVQTRSITHLIHSIKDLTSSTNKQAHIIAWLADQQGKLHQDYEESSLGQALQSQNIRDSIAEVQRMSEVLSANQLRLFELGNEVIRGNQAMLGQRLKRLSEAQSQVDKKLEDLIKLVKIPADHSSIHSYLAGVIPAITELQRSIILLAAQFHNADRRLHPITTLLTTIQRTQQTHLTTINSISSSLTQLTTHLKTTHNTFTTADRTLLHESVSKQKTLEADVRDIKHTLTNILQLLQSGQLEVAAKRAPSKGEKKSTAEGEQGTSKGEQHTSTPLVNVVEEDIPEELDQSLKRKGKMPAVQVSEGPTKDVSDKVVKKVISMQKARMHEGTSASDEIDEKLIAAAQGVSVEYVRQQRQKEKEEEASLKLVEELAREEMMAADENTKKLAAKHNLTPQEILKRKEAEFHSKKQEEKENFLKAIKKRKRSEKIVGIQASVSQQGKSINVVLTREGARVTEAINNIQKKTLGATEWIEIHDIIKERTGANLMGLHKMITEYFDNLRKYERKFGIKDSLLAKIDSSTPPAPMKTKKRKVADISTFLNRPIEEEGDERLNVELPAGVDFKEGKVISDPAGIFYTSLRGVRKFFRADEADLASTRFLVLIKKLCARTSNEETFIQYIESCLNEPHRIADPALKKIKQEYSWD